MKDESSQSPEVLAVIMARAGSVGLPGKSVLPLLGRPVIEYTFEHVRAAKLVTRVVVSSDDAKVLELGRGAGFEVIERPAELATATSATDPVLRHALGMLYGVLTTESTEDTETDGKRDGTASVNSVPSVTKMGLPAAVVMLYGNVPVRQGGMIDRCVEMLFETGCDSVQTIAPVGKTHPYWMFDRAGDGRISKHIPNNVFRRQDLPGLYAPTGAVYVMRTEVLMAAGGGADPHAFLGVDRRGLVVGTEDSVDIDTKRDLFLAEAVMRSIASGGGV